jgi:two-component system, NarL family, sensor histidine kinase DesK
VSEPRGAELAVPRDRTDTSVVSLGPALAAYYDAFPSRTTHLSATPIRPLTYILFGSSGTIGPKGGETAVAAAAETPERQRRVKMVTWTAAWLLVLGAPTMDIVHGHDHPAAVAWAVLALFAGTFLAHWWRISNPDSGLLAKVALLPLLIGIAVASSLAFHGTWPYLFFFASAAVGCALPEKWALFGIAGVTVIDAIVVGMQPSMQLLGGQIFGVFLSGLIVLFMFRMLRLIRDLNSARQEVARLAVADERLRFARDLHDLLGHTLSLIAVKSEAVRRLVHEDADAAARESGDIELVSRQALAEVREAVTNYRERSLEAELEGARVALSAAGIEATIHQSAEHLPEMVESVLGWTVREGVTNVVRHSNGQHCAIDLRRNNGMAVLEICDDGNTGEIGAGRSEIGSDRAELLSAGAFEGDPADSGGPAGRTGTGLRGLTERLASAHGRLEAGRRPGGGFRLAVTVPLDSEAQSV